MMQSKKFCHYCGHPLSVDNSCAHCQLQAYVTQLEQDLVEKQPAGWYEDLDRYYTDYPEDWEF